MSKPSQRICCPIIVVQITEFQNDENSNKKSQLALQRKISSQFIPIDAVQNVRFVETIKARKKTKCNILIFCKKEIIAIHLCQSISYLL